jgi:Ca2+-binding EF-hand superfamily protein
MNRLIIIAIVAAFALISANDALAFKGMGSMGSGGQGFEMLDTNGDGVVDEEEYMAPFYRWDEDGDKELTREEWLAGHGGAVDKREAHGKGKKIDVPFSKMDADGDGVISESEYSEKFPGMGSGFTMIDADDSGVLEEGEWDSFLKSHRGMGY